MDNNDNKDTDAYEESSLADNHNEFGDFIDVEESELSDDEILTTEDAFDDDLSFDGSDDFETEDNFDEIDYSKPIEKSGPNWFNIGIIGAVIIAIGTITYTSFPGLFKSSGAQQKPQNAVAQQQATQPNNQNDPNSNQPSLFDDPSILGGDTETSQIPQSENIVPDDLFEAVDNVPSISDQEIDDIFAAIPQATQQIPTPPVEETSLPDLSNIDVDTLPMPSDISTPIVSDEMPLQNTPVETTTTTSLDTPNVNVMNTDQIDALNNRIDDMNQSMDSFMKRLENRIDNIQIPQSQTQTASVNYSDQINQLQQTITRLENRMNDLATKPAVQAVTPPTPVETPLVIMEETKSKDHITVLTPTPEPESAKKKIVSVPKRVKPAYIPPKIIWELRGASNGQAFLAERGTQNLRTVTTGQTLRDLGRITSIAQENGQWIVRATNGVVRQ